VLTGIITENENGGRSTSCNAGLNNAQSTRLLSLADNENIIRITACRGAYYGYTKITFETDKGQSITCGSSSYTYKPDNYQTYSAEYMTKSWRRPGSESSLRSNRTSSNRSLLEAAAAAAVSPAPGVSLAALGGASGVALVPASSSNLNAKGGNSTQVEAAHHRRRREQRRREREDTNRYFRNHNGWGWNRCAAQTGADGST
jgi:hypothetical protein